MKRYFFPLLFCSVILLQAQENDFGALLKTYADTHELYRQTKLENAGHVIIFSREDIDRMQAYTLTDLLKTVRFFNVRVDSRGLAVPVVAGAADSYNQPIRIFIDDYQIESNTFGSPLDKVGQINLYFIDHVEIYLSGSSTLFGGEAGNIIIKLYTKKAERENGAFLQVFGSDSSYHGEEALFAGEVGKAYSFLVNASRLEERYETLHSEIGPLDRDGTRYDLYAKLARRDNFVIDMEYIRHDYDMFKSALKKDIAKTEGKLENFHIHLLKQLPWQLAFDASFTEETNGLYFLTNGFKMPLSNGQKVSELDQVLVTRIGYTALTKKSDWKQLHLLLRAEYKQSRLKLKHFKGEGVEMDHISGPRNNIRRTTISLHGRYDIDEASRMVMGVRRSFVHLDQSGNKKLDYLRLGFISTLFHRIDFKIFATRKEILPTSKELYYSTVIYSNPDLSPYSFDTVSAEAIYNGEGYLLSAGVGKNYIKDAVVVDETRTFVNSGLKQSNYGGYLRMDYFLNPDNKWIIELFKNRMDDPQSPTAGAYLALFNRFGDFECYNGLLFRDAYTDKSGHRLKASVDWTAAVTWHWNRRLLFKLKGENLLDRGYETYIADKSVSAAERRIILALEYSF